MTLKKLPIQVHEKTNGTLPGSDALAQRPRVLIVGGGLGGLAFAQALRKQGITCQIFERDIDLNARLQGWAVMLQW